MDKQNQKQKRKRQPRPIIRDKFIRRAKDPTRVSSWSKCEKCQAWTLVNRFCRDCCASKKYRDTAITDYYPAVTSSPVVDKKE